MKVIFACRLTKLVAPADHRPDPGLDQPSASGGWFRGLVDCSHGRILAQISSERNQRLIVRIEWCVKQAAVKSGPTTDLYPVTVKKTNQRLPTFGSNALTACSGFSSASPRCQSGILGIPVIPRRPPRGPYTRDHGARLDTRQRIRPAPSTFAPKLRQDRTAGGSGDWLGSVKCIVSCIGPGLGLVRFNPSSLQGWRGFGTESRQAVSG